MAFFDKDDLYDVYTQSKDEAYEWRRDYKEYERLADNDLLPDLDESLPEVNDGSLAASLFKLPKRIVSSKLTGRAKALDVDDAWITELANMQWENNIIPNANSQAPFHRKWKDAVRKAAIYGGQPIITLFVNNGNYTGADFIVPLATDVTLEAGKVSDYDSDVIFWDVYFTKKQVSDMIEQAKNERAVAKEEGTDGYNKWNVKALEEILSARMEEERDTRDDHNKVDGKSVKKKGFHFCIAFQRGIEAPFYMYHKDTKKMVREWSNPDPTGDIPVHYLYCYQDFINPYGTGIVKLAGGTQNVLDYMRQADILATQLGIRPPKLIRGDEDSVDLDSLVYAQDADWFVGQTVVERLEMSNQIYQQLPERVSMYKTSLNQLIPTGDTSISSGAGDPQYSKTPAGVKFQAASLSIDDEDFKDNLYMTYEAVAKSMINTHFANMQGTDLMKLSDEERDILIKAGLEFPTDPEGNPTNELEIIWDEARATFDFEVDAEEDKAKDDETKLEALLKVAELRAADPTLEKQLMASGKKFNVGELFAAIINLTTDNDKIIEDIDPEDIEAQEDRAMAGEIPAEEQELPLGEETAPEVEPANHMEPEDLTPEEAASNVRAVMEAYGVNEQAAAFSLEMERSGSYDEEEIKQFLLRQRDMEQANA